MTGALPDMISVCGYGWSAQTAHTRNCTFAFDAPDELRRVTVHPSTSGAVVTRTNSAALLFVPGVGGVPSVSGSHPPPSGFLLAEQCTLQDTNAPFATAGLPDGPNTSLSDAIVS